MRSYCFVAEVTFNIIAEWLNISLKWIYLEHHHGKGIPDGIGAVVKRSIKSIIASNPDVPIYDAQQLFERLPEITASIAYHLYSED